jgi:hypothetical protein
MYYVQEATFLVQQEALELFQTLTTTLVDPWLLQQEGVVDKRILIETTEINPVIVKNLVTWYSVDAAAAIDQNEYQAIYTKMDDSITASGFIYQILEPCNYFSITTIDQGMVDDDNDQDDNSNILSDGDMIIPDIDTPMEDITEMSPSMESIEMPKMTLSDISMKNLMDACKNADMSEDDFSNMSMKDMMNICKNIGMMNEDKDMEDMINQMSDISMKNLMDACKNMGVSDEDMMSMSMKDMMSMCKNMMNENY